MRVKSRAAAAPRPAAAPLRPATFSFTAPAELFSVRSRKGAGYRRFDNAAAAIRFAVEELPPSVLLGAHLEVNEVRFDQNGIRALYERADYPLPRTAKAAA